MPTTSDTLTTLASGTVTAPGTGTWQHLALTFNGSSISAAINGTTVASVTGATYASGMAGFGTTGYQTDQFDNLSVTLAGSATPTGHIITGDDTAECADVNGGSAADGTKVQMWGCNSNAAAQSWTVGVQRHRRHQRQVPGHHRRQHGQRCPHRGVDLQRRQQPAVVGALTGLPAAPD